MALEGSPVGPIISVSDVESARSFYEGKLGLEGEETPGGFLLRAGEGTVIYLLPIGDSAGGAHDPVASFRVEDVGAMTVELRDRGVPFLGADDVPFDVDENGVARQEGLTVSWMRDPDGNTLTLFSTD